MGKVSFNITMSLDGFVAGPNDGPTNPLGDGGAHLFTWFGRGDTEYKMPGGDWKFKVSAASAAQLDRAIKSVGVLVTGRRTFDIAKAWGGQHPPRCADCGADPSCAARVGKGRLTLYLCHRWHRKRH